MRILILVDLQNDFMPGGALAVTNGDQVVDVANKLIPLFDRVILTQDFHPPGHGSFASTHDAEVYSMGELDGLDQVMWPDHCVQGTEGCMFHKGLVFPADTILEQRVAIIQKGQDPNVDSYSAFFDNAQRNKTMLDMALKEIDEPIELFIMGLATDYCVKFTVLDALKLEYDVTLITDGCRGVNQNPDDSEKAIAEMEKWGAKLIASKQIIDAA